MATQELSKLRLKITARQSVTVLPRVLQILSRRGFILTNLTTGQNDDSTVTLTLTVTGDARWNDAIPHLLSRLVDVMVVAEVSHV